MPKGAVEGVRQALQEAGLIDFTCKIKADGPFICIPLAPEATPDQLEKIDGQLAIEECDFETKSNLKSVELMLGFHPKYEITGDIAIIPDGYEKNVADAILSVHRNVKTVLMSDTDVSGDRARRTLTYVSGEERTTTVCRENGFSFRIDLATASYNPRLSTERKRVASQAEATENVIDMFAGIGAYAVQIAPHARHVTAIERNPAAFACLEQNFSLNHVANVTAVNLDVRDFKTDTGYDRVIMSHPYIAGDYLDVAFQLAREGSVIYYYTIMDEYELDAEICSIKEKAACAGCGVELAGKRTVQAYSTDLFLIALDLRVSGKKTST